ncbi:class I SAM-dependent methyltransferase [Komagataeibacter europaeus]|uniref:hypothetical protein n=1 Tax=Komagataeibacter europaeus TaxID=33995 RepID=UPI0015F86923|nr:hypothetical protein [Komagataeibacter europaeus]
MNARPKSGVIGKDKDCLNILLPMHCPEGGKILDCTHNKGTMWKGVNIPGTLTRMDIDPSHPVDVVGDFSTMSCIFQKNNFDVIVFDPPHLPVSAASKGSSNIWKHRYGITNQIGVGRDGDNVSGMFSSFFNEAKTILKRDGIILCKIADMIHNHKYQWQHIDLINSAIQCGMTACDMMVKIETASGNLASSKWKNVHHLRRNHTFWVIIRNSDRCERTRHVTMEVFP